VVRGGGGGAKHGTKAGKLEGRSAREEVRRAEIARWPSGRGAEGRECAGTIDRDDRQRVGCRYGAVYFPSRWGGGAWRL
jgi:hypothetical protein